MNDQIVQVLTGARERVSKGWIQGAAASGDGKQVCAIQAISATWQNLVREYRTTHPGNLTYPLTQLGTLAAVVMLNAVNELYDGEWSEIPDWNDTPGRTLDEVLYTFDHAIKLADREE